MAKFYFKEMVEILSYGDSLTTGNYKIHSRFSSAVNFMSDNSIISVVNKGVGSGPVNIVVDGIELKTIQSLIIDDAGFVLNNSRFEFNLSKQYNSKIRLNKINKDKFEVNLDFFERCLFELSSPMSLAFLLEERRKENFKTSFEKELVKRFELGVAKIFSANPIEGIKKIKGAGFGLTPSGDDFICGFLIALNIAKKLLKLKNFPKVFRLTQYLIFEDIKRQNFAFIFKEPSGGFFFSRLIDETYNAAKGKNSISNAFLLCAKEGRLFERFKKLVYSIFHNGEQEIFECTKGLLSVGETSGADMAVGLVVGLTGCNYSAKLRVKPTRKNSPQK